MPTIAAGASATITLPAGRTFTDSGGSGWVTVFGPGQSAGQTYALINNGALGPYAEDRSIYIAAQQAVEYSIDGPPSPVGVLPSGQMVNLDTLSPVSGGGITRTVAFYGDSLTENSATFVTQTTVQAFALGASFWVRGTEISCPAGVGALTYDATAKTLTWAPNGAASGPATDASKTGIIYVPGAAADSGILLDWFGANRTYTSGTASPTVQAAGFHKHNYNTNGFGYCAMSFCGGLLSIGEQSLPQHNNEAWFGLGGGSSQELLAAQWQWSNISTGIAVVCAGQNDAPAGLTGEQTYQNILAIIDNVQASKVYVCTIPPRNGDTAEQKKVKANINARLAEFAESSAKCEIFDLNKYLADPATGDYLAAFSTDLVHPNGRGGMSAGRGLSSTMLSAVGGPRRVFAESAYGVYDAINNPRGSLFPTAGMPGMNGVAGSVGAGVVGTAIPTGWRARRTAGSAMTITTSKVARGDIPGEDWQIVLAGSVATETCTVDTGLGLTISGFVGQYISGYVDVDVASCTGITEMSLQFFDNGSATQAQAGANLDGQIGNFTGKRRIAINRWPVPSGATNFGFNFVVKVAAAGSVTMKIVEANCTVGA